MDSSVFGKRVFIICYRRVREKALTAENIKSGFRTTGLWPLNITKPLISPLLLENHDQRRKSNYRNESRLQKGQVTPPHQINTHLWAFTRSWVTPKRIRDLTVQLNELDRLQRTNSTARLLFEKIAKYFTEKYTFYAFVKREKRILKVKLQEQAPRKRKRVVPDPNAKFVNIWEVCEAQREAGHIYDALEDAPEADESDVLSNSIVVNASD